MERIPVHGIGVFLTIVKTGSMRAAAESLGVGAPAISIQLKALEDKLGVGLLHRTTRSIELTQAGQTLFEAASPAYRDLTYAVKKTQEIGNSATGTLRLSLSRAAYMTAIAPVLDRFMQDHPGINLDLSLNEALVDIVHEGYHAGIRLGDILQPDMIAVRLTPTLTPVFSAYPQYLKKHGRPKHPRELLKHRCIRYRPPSSSKVSDWHFVENGQQKTVNPPIHLVFDNVLGVVQAAREGHGIGWSLRQTVKEYFENGSLEPILENYVEDLPPFYLYYPEQNRRVECLRLLIDCFVRHRDKTAKSALGNSNANPIGSK